MQCVHCKKSRHLIKIHLGHGKFHNTCTLCLYFIHMYQTQLSQLKQSTQNIIEKCTHVFRTPTSQTWCIKPSFLPTVASEDLPTPLKKETSLSMNELPEFIHRLNYESIESPSRRKSLPLIGSNPSRVIGFQSELCTCTICCDLLCQIISHGINVE